MTIDLSRYERKLSNRLNDFSGNFMSNTKWKKLFLKLSENKDHISKCLIKDIFDDVLRDIEIPTIENYASTFDDEGIKDVMSGGPSTFKEIERLEFPSQWEIIRDMRGQILEPHKYKQDIFQIKNVIQQEGQLEIEFGPDKLIIYGYK